MTKRARLASVAASAADMPKSDHDDRSIDKSPTGIIGFDEITSGGLPVGRLTSVIGGPGAGKTLFALQTLMSRLDTRNEPGVFVTFEEPVNQIKRNISSFDWPVRNYDKHGLSFIDARMPVEAILAGSFDLAGLLAGLDQIKRETGAQTVVFDGIDVLLSNLHDEQLERRELGRLDEWIRGANVSALITVKSFSPGERDQRRSDMLQYITDCVIVLECALTPTTSSRSLRIVKYRGSGYVSNPVPVVIGPSGLEVVAFKGVRLNYPTFTDRVSSGVARLDGLVSGGYLRGSSILISGAPGTSKTSLSANFAAAACERGEKALFISFDESAAQVVSNMRSIGLDLAPHLANGRLTMESLLSSGRSPEEHFVAVRKLIDAHSPDCLVVDPLSSLLRADYPFTELICENLLDNAKARGITVLCTSLLDHVSGEEELSASNVSAISDTWIQVSYIANHGERNRALTIIKSRGTSHSNQVRELVLDQTGVNLVDVYLAEGRVLMGSARLQKEAEDRRNQVQEQQAYQGLHRQMGRDIAELTMQLQAATEELAWKKQEAAFVAASEAARAVSERAAADTRLTFREGGTGSPATVARLRGRRKKG